MAKPDNRADVDRLKQLLTEGWNRILRKAPDERVYAFGIYTNECGQSMFPFLLGEKGLERVASEYVKKGLLGAESAVEDLRWSTADSPYVPLLSNTVHDFDGRPDVFDLSPTAMAREVHYRLTAGCTALRELDQEGLFGAGAKRADITLYVEGGDVSRVWLLEWAKKLNPKAIFERFAKIGAPEETVGNFTEFGTKKVYETTQYAQTADRKLIAAATQYQLFVFDTTGPRQLFARALPAKGDLTSLGGVAMSGDGKVIAVIPFGGGKHGKELFVITGSKGESVLTVALKACPSGVAVEPAGAWIAVTDQSGALNIFDSVGSPLGSHHGHSGWPRGIAVPADGSLIVTADTESLVVWNTADWSKRCVLSISIDSVDFDATGRLLVGCCRYKVRGAEPRAATLIAAHEGRVIKEVAVEGHRIERARFSPDGQYLACALRLDTEGYSGTNISALVNIETGAVVDWLKADFEQVRDFAFLPHRNEIAVAVFGHTRRPLVLWRPKGL